MVEVATVIAVLAVINALGGFLKKPAKKEPVPICTSDAFLQAASEGAYSAKAEECGLRMPDRVDTPPAVEENESR